jgi:putative hemolysin
MSGFVIGLLGRIPDEDDLPTLTYANMQIKVLAMDEKRISKLEITVLPESSDE